MKRIILSLKSSAKGFFIVLFAIFNVKIFKKIKILINTFFFEDYKSLLFGIFIFLSLIYKYIDIFDIKDYYINAKVKYITSDGYIVIKRKHFEDKIKIKDLKLPSFFNKCSSDFKNYFFIKMNEYIDSNNNLIDIKITKKNLFSIEGIFFIKNKNIIEYIDDTILIKNFIPKDKQNDWCFILKKVNSNPEKNFIKLKNKLSQVKDFFRNIFNIQLNKYF